MTITECEKKVILSIIDLLQTKHTRSQLTNENDFDILSEVAEMLIKNFPWIYHYSIAMLQSKQLKDKIDKILNGSNEIPKN